MLKKLILLTALVAPLALTGCADDLMTDTGSDPGIAPEATSSRAAPGDSEPAARCLYEVVVASDDYDITSGNRNRTGKVAIQKVTQIPSCLPAPRRVAIHGTSDFINGVNQNIGCMTHSVSGKVYINGSLVDTFSDSKSNRSYTASGYRFLYEGSDYAVGDVISATITHTYTANDEPSDCQGPIGLSVVEVEQVSINTGVADM